MWNKKRKKDLALIISDEISKVAGVFTKNTMKAAPVKITQEYIKNGKAKGIIVNSGNANCFTGEDGFKNTKKMGTYLISELNKLKEKYKVINEIRGIGLMIGVSLTIEGKEIIDKCMERGLIINCTQKNILRIMPALNVTQKQINKAIYILDKVIEEIEKKTNKDLKRELGKLSCKSF